MIDRREILDIANALGLLPQIIEKDYVLGWVLAGIYSHDALSESWIFKGGTCLKKCYFETYRFSEDLDFTVTDPSHIDEDFLRSVFGEIAARIYEETGIELPEGLQGFEIYENPRGTLSCQGRLSYRGPIAPRSGGLPRIKLDLTADELLVLPPVGLPIFHPYSDAPEDGINVRSYAYEEAFAEKVRAFFDRTRPRDLYDVINLFRNAEARPSPPVLLDVLRQKCAHRGIPIPRLADLDERRPDLEGAWEPMLGRQLPALPPLETFWSALHEFFAWLETGVAPVVPAAYRMAAGETVLRERTLRLPLSGTAQSYIEIIRFAAANRLCVDLHYQGSVRRIEPYSLRRTGDGNIILHAIRTEDSEHRSYRVDSIQGAQTTGQSFIPLYDVELTAHGPVAIQPTTTRPASSGSRRSSWPSSGRTRTSRTTGPRHVYECSYCGKRFYRKNRTSRLNPHKDKHGYRCPGRTAIYIDTKY